jgi:5'-AMP-activated protein kinase regulatory beta subunit
MTKKSGNNATLELNLAPGAYQYKFVVNDDWKCDPKQDTQQDGSGNVNNQVIVA